MPRGIERLRPVQDRHRPFELAYRGPDARRTTVRRAPARIAVVRQGGAHQRHAVRIARRHRQGARQRQGHPAGAVRPRTRHRRCRSHRGHRRTHPDYAHACSCSGPTSISFDERRDLTFNHKDTLPLHSNGMLFAAFAADGAGLTTGTYYSVGGGFVVTDEPSRRRRHRKAHRPGSHRAALPVSHRR